MEELLIKFNSSVNMRNKHYSRAKLCLNNEIKVPSLKIRLVKFQKMKYVRK